LRQAPDQIRVRCPRKLRSLALRRLSRRTAVRSVEAFRLPTIRRDSRGWSDRRRSHRNDAVTPIRGVDGEFNCPLAKITAIAWPRPDESLVKIAVTDETTGGAKAEGAPVVPSVAVMAAVLFQDIKVCYYLNAPW
jgi:hypothetical protein